MPIDEGPAAAGGAGAGQPEPVAWLARHPRSVTTARLVVYTIPPVGAGAGVHRELAQSVASDIDVLTLRLPGREKRRDEPPLPTLAGCVDDLAGRVAADAAHHGLPYVLVGDCATGLLGYELARALELAAGPAPAALLAVAGRSPRYGYRDSRRHLAPAEQLRDEVSAGGLMPPEITADQSVFRLFEPVVRADLAACETYQWDGRPLAGVPVVVLLPAGYLADPSFTSWQEATRAGVRLVPMAGDAKAALQVITASAPPPQVAEQLAALRDQLTGGGGGGPATVRERVAALWTGFLPESTGGEAENFLDIGGDSIVAVRLRNALQEQLGSAPPLEVILRGPTLGELVALVGGQVDHDRGGTSGGSERPTSGEPRRPAEHPPDDLPGQLSAVVGEVLGVGAGQLCGNGFGALGGSSLDAARAAVRIRERLGVIVDSQRLLRASDLDTLVRQVAGGARLAAEPAEQPAPDDGGLVRLTWQQRVIWYQSVLDPGSPRYHFYALLHFDTAPELERLREALARQLARHPALRIRLAFQDGQPGQVVALSPVVAAELDLIEVRMPAPATSPEQLVAAVGADASFDLSTGPLVRWRLAVFPDGRATLVHAEHHLVHDGRSFQAFLESLADQSDPAPDRRYFTYAASQPAAEPEQLAQVAQECRRAELELFPDPPEAPADEDWFLRLPVPDRLLAAVRAAAQRASTTLFSGLLAAFGQALVQHQRLDTLVLGSAVDNRPAGHEDTVGMFVSTVPVLVERQRDESHQAVVQRVDRALAAAIQRAGLPLPDLVAVLGGADQRGGDHLIRAAFSMHQQPEETFELAGRPARVELGVFNGAAKFPVNVVALASGTGAATRVQLLLEGAAEAVTGDDLWALWTLAIRWLQEWVGQRPAAGTGQPGQLVGRVAGHASSPGGDAPALDDGRERLSYRQLVALGEAARGSLGWAGRRVGILGTASTRFFGCAHAALHAGATYVPLPVEKPAATLVEIVRRAGCEVVVDVTGDPDQPVLAELRRTAPAVVCLRWADIAAAGGGAPEPAGGAAAGPPVPAYVMFTSGSTGVPKGIVVGRPALDRLAAWAAGELDLSSGMVVGQTASVSFDASVFELWSALYAGAQLKIAPAQLRPDPYGLTQWLDDEQVERVFVGTPIAELIFQMARQPSRLRVMSTGGDRLHPLPEGLPYRVINMYGPAETTVISMASWVTPGGSRLPPIGRPLPYARVRVVAADGSEVPTGERGELWVGGGGLAEGYLDNPRLTVARFVADPYSQWGEPVYRTGDLVRQRTDGRFGFVGRDDRQVQVGGVRTELGEIEAIALRQPGIRQAAAVAGEDGQRSWVRVYVVADRPVDGGELGQAIRTALPPHLRHLPVHPVAELPLTANGKVDRAALAAAGPAPPAAPATPAAPAAPAAPAPLAAPATPAAPAAPAPLAAAQATAPAAAELLAPLLEHLSTEDALALAYRLLGSVLGENDHKGDSR
jgi:amino acid adenylation domain-containing protein